MSVIVLASAKASPGVTTTVTALAAAWPHERAVLILEADPDGGVLAARHGLTPEPGLSTLAVEARRAISGETIARHQQRLSESDVFALVAPPTAEQARRAIGLAAQPISEVLTQLTDTDVLVDVGRLRPGSEAWPLVEVADAVLLVARPQLDELQQLPARVQTLDAITPRLGLILVGDRPYPAAEVASTLDIGIAAVVADDPTTADALNGRTGTRKLERTPLMRSIHHAVASIRHGLDRPPGSRRAGSTGSRGHQSPVEVG